MNFTEVIFLPFLLVVLGLERLLRKPTNQNWMLLFASILFYGWWKVELLPLLAFSSGVDFVAGNRISSSEDPKVRRRWLALALSCNIGLLGFFKYANFGIRTVNDVALGLGANAAPFHPLDIILPIGISFYTFQSMSYSIDVYRRTLEPERSYPRFLSFVTLFPQLVAGPIVRASVLLPQMRSLEERRYDDSGIFLVLVGFAKKLLIADLLGALLVDPAFSDPESKSSLTLLLAAYGYSFQIFCDFSGYSDIAIGIGRLLGFSFPKNFDAPYLASSLTDFWRRWHMTLSTWFRDYVYMPLGGSRGTRAQWLFASMSVFLISGLWHGASYTFIIWGLIHGVVFVSERLVGATRLGRLGTSLRDSAPRSYTAIRQLITFHIVTVAWVFFRSDSLRNALKFLRCLFGNFGKELTPIAPIVGLALGAAALLHVVLEPKIDDAARGFVRLPALAQASLAMILGAAVYSGAESALAHRAFIYFQF